MAAQRVASVLVLFFAVASRVLAQDSAQSGAATPEKQKQQADALEKFSGAGFGAGITLTVFPHGNAGIRSAEVANGVVRVTEEQQSLPRIMIETHYFFTPQKAFLKIVDRKMWGWGPFLGIQNGSEEIVESVGAGLLLGFRRSPEKADSFNFGIGAIYDTNVKTLGDGLSENAPLPAGETAVRFKKSGKWGWVFLFSFGF